MLFLPFSSIHCLSSRARCKKHKKLPSKEEVSPQRKSLRHKKGEKPSSLTVSLSSPRLLPSLIYWLAAFLHGRKKTTVVFFSLANEEGAREMKAASSLLRFPSQSFTLSRRPFPPPFRMHEFFFSFSLLLSFFHWKLGNNPLAPFLLPLELNRTDHSLAKKCRRGEGEETLWRGPRSQDGAQLVHEKKATGEERRRWRFQSRKKRQRKTREGKKSPSPHTLAQFEVF